MTSYWELSPPADMKPPPKQASMLGFLAAPSLTIEENLARQREAADLARKEARAKFGSAEPVPAQSQAELAYRIGFPEWPVQRSTNAKAGRPTKKELWIRCLEGWVFAQPLEVPTVLPPYARPEEWINEKTSGSVGSWLEKQTTAAQVPRERWFLSDGVSERGTPFPEGWNVLRATACSVGSACSEHFAPLLDFSSS